MVNEGVISTQIAVFPAQAVETVRAQSQDLVHGVSLQRLYIPASLRLVEVFVADPPGRVARATLLFPEHGKRHVRSLQDLHEAARDLLITRIKCRRAADP